MKSKAPLALIELLIMLMVFSLAAAWCLQAFSLADRISRRSAARDSAAVQAQNAAELLQHFDGDYAAADHCGGSWDGETLRISFDSRWNVTASDAVYLVEVLPVETDSPFLGKAEITVTDAGGDCLITFPAAWQEE